MSYRSHNNERPGDSSGGRKRGYPDDSTNSYGNRDRGGLAPVVAKHYNEIEEKGVAAREESRIFHMRSFNNWIKSMLISSLCE